MGEALQPSDCICGPPSNVFFYFSPLSHFSLIPLLLHMLDSRHQFSVFVGCIFLYLNRDRTRFHIAPMTLMGPYFHINYNLLEKTGISKAIWHYHLLPKLKIKFPFFSFYTASKLIVAMLGHVIYSRVLIRPCNTYDDVCLDDSQ